MSSLLKKYPSNAIKKAGEKYKISGDTSALLETLKKQNRVYETISPELQQKLHHMKSDIVDNLQKLEPIGQIPEYLKKLEDNSTSILSKEQKVFFDNIIELIKKNSNNALTENDIKIQDGKLYLCGTMFYGDIFESDARERNYFLEPNNIIKDGHQLSFKSLVEFTTKLYGIQFNGYSNIFDGRFKGNQYESKEYFNDLYERNKDFFEKMANILSGGTSYSGALRLYCSIPICVDYDNNVFYYDQYGRNHLSTIASNDMPTRNYIYKPEFIV